MGTKTLLLNYNYARLRLKLICIAAAVVLAGVFIAVNAGLQRESRQLKTALGQYCCETVEYLDNSTRTLEGYIDDIDHLDREMLQIIGSQLQYQQREFESQSMRLPLKKDYYANMYMAAASFTAELCNESSGEGWNEYRKSLLQKLEDILDKLIWSFELIKSNSGEYKTIEGYYFEMYSARGNTRTAIEKELERYLEDVHGIISREWQTAK